MIGRVAFLNPLMRTGIIFGSDRIRYTFSLADWPEPVPPQRNQDVNILVQDGRVTSVRPLGGDFTEAVEESVPEVEQPLPKKPRAGTPDVPIQAIESFRGQMEYGASDATIAPEEPEYAQKELDNGEAFPEMFPDEPMVRPMGSLLFTMPDARSSRSNGKRYAIGAGIVALMVLLGFATMHM